MMHCEPEWSSPHSFVLTILVRQREAREIVCNSQVYGKEELVYSSYCPHKTTEEAAAQRAEPNQASDKKRITTIGMICGNSTVPGSVLGLIDTADQYVREHFKRQEGILGEAGPLH